MAQIAPTFASKPNRAAEVDEGETFTLNAKLDGSPIPSVQWYKDGELFKPDERVQMTALPDGTVALMIKQVIPSDCGAYRLVATNPNGEAATICAVAVNRK